MKYKEWLILWLDNYICPSAKGKTYIRYSEIVKNHLIPTLGEYELEELTALVLQCQITNFLQAGNLKTCGPLAPSSVNLIIAVIQDSLRTAYSLGYVSSNESDKIRRPQVQEKSVLCFSVSEQKTIEQAVLNDKRVKMLGIVLCLYTGLRIGELLALEWSDVNFDMCEFSITKTCHDSKSEDGTYVRIINTPKTPTSTRTIPIPKKLLPIVKILKKNSCSNYVISEGSNGITVRSYQRSFELLLKKLKIKHRGFHSLRHTFATRALECGMDVKTLSEILGHKNPAITLRRYAHSLMEHKRAMMDKVGKLL